MNNSNTHSGGSWFEKNKPPTAKACAVPIGLEPIRQWVPCSRSRSQDFSRGRLGLNERKNWQGLGLVLWFSFNNLQRSERCCLPAASQPGIPSLFQRIHSSHFHSCTINNRPILRVAQEMLHLLYVSRDSWFSSVGLESLCMRFALERACRAMASPSQESH